MDSISGSGRNNERENIVRNKISFCGGTNNSAEKYFNRIIKDREKSRAVGDLERQRTERTTQKCFI